MGKQVKWTQEKITLLTDLMKQHASWGEISNSVNIPEQKCKEFVWRNRRKINLPYRNEKYDTKQLKTFYEEYGHNKTLDQFGSYAIKFLQKNHNFKCYKQEKRTDNHVQFMATEDAYYFAGLMYADGSVTIGGIGGQNVVRICLKWSDINLLKEIETKIGGAIYPRSDKSAAEWCLHSKELAIDLKRFGIIPRKTHNHIVPDLSVFPDDKAIVDFIRGFFDGDGCFSMWKEKNRWRPNVSFHGSQKILNWIQFHLQRLFNVSTKTIKKDKSIKCLAYTSKNEWQTISNGLYSLGKSKMCLARKRNKYIEITRLLNNQDNPHA
jgi:hypothetical protein